MKKNHFKCQEQIKQLPDARLLFFLNFQKNIHPYLPTLHLGRKKKQE